MCWEACFVCWQCEYFTNGCQGQMGTFYQELCPYYECLKEKKVSVGKSGL